jgi:hypothetical protein
MTKQQRKLLGLVFALAGLVGILASIGCYDPRAQDSRIVREVEGNGAGDLTTYDSVSLQQWFGQHPQLATKIAAECIWPSKHSDASWARSAEGTTCYAATMTAPAPEWVADPRGW